MFGFAVPTGTSSVGQTLLFGGIYPQPERKRAPYGFSKGFRSRMNMADESGIEPSGVGSVSTARSEGPVWIDSLLGSREAVTGGGDLENWRNVAEASLNGLMLPSRKEESWRFTDLRSLYRMRFVRSHAAVGKESMCMIPEEVGTCLVFVDGVFADRLSTVERDITIAGGYAGSLKEFRGDRRELEKVLSTGETAVEDGIFATLNLAIARDMAVLKIPSNYGGEKPIGLIFISSGGTTADAATASAARVAVIAEANSNVTFLELHASANEKERPFFFSSGCVGIVAKSGSRIRHILSNETNPEAHYVGQIHASVERNASYELVSVISDGAVSRTTCGIDLNESGAHGSIRGLIIVDGKRISDLHSRISHKAPDGSSDQLQKNIATDRGRAIFNGKILVKREARGTNSSQMCRSVLMSDKARIDAMPVLEIGTQDVSCTHGATVADLNEDELFYLQSRGVTEAQAQVLLLTSFTSEILQDLPLKSIQERTREKVVKLVPTLESKKLEHSNYTSI